MLLIMDAGCVRAFFTSDASGSTDSVAVTDFSLTDLRVRDQALADIPSTDKASASDLNTITLLTDDFSSSDLSGWVLTGTPKPTQIATAHGRSGIFDNNGDGNYASVALSKKLYTCLGGCTLVSDVYLDFSKLSGCWAMPTIGLTSKAYPNGNGYTTQPGVWPGGVCLGLSAEGDACWVTPKQNQRHAWFRASIFAEDATTESTWLIISADSYVNKWTELKIVIHADRTVSFYADGKLLWQPTKRIDASILSGRNIRLGSRSSGSAGKAYHDNIRLLK